MNAGGQHTQPNTPDYVQRMKIIIIRIEEHRRKHKEKDILKVYENEVLRRDRAETPRSTTR